MEKETKRPPCFKISVPGDDSKKQLVLSKLQKVRTILVQQLNHPVNNADILEKVLDYFLLDHNGQSSKSDMTTLDLNTYIQVQKKDVDQKLFLTAETSLQKIIKVVENHSSICNGHFSIKKLTPKGHVAAVRFNCDTDKHHSMLWSSSPYLPNGEYLANLRTFHGYICSGMLPVHYNRFANAAKIGHINKQKQQYMFQRYKNHIEQQYNESIESAVLEEIGMYDELTGINIITDARHGWRKNAKDSSVVAIGEKIHKVLKCEHITKSDDSVSQRHEKLGTQRIYHYLEEQDVQVNVHSHDRNLSINKLVKDTGIITNQNDPWHAIKKVKVAMKRVSAGPKYLKEKSWSAQLEDKVESVATHFHWAVRNCEENPKELKDVLLNIVEHYKNNHQKCHPDSRCKRDTNYEPKRIIISIPIAEKLLLGVIRKSTIYTHPEDYVLAKDTCYVESFNNTMNMFQDKRIAFSNDNYQARSQLAVCHWNENVDRDFTSIWNPNRRNAPRSNIGKKNYKPPTYNYRQSIWARQINSFIREKIERN
ncbi:unnamed protein product [Mytilus edulis]|uniref:Mutator-like transposase domain-containing protein n=1 Tax=Mytilus edulis TaxID=6550 RepID=A0A8S3UMH1_MYTED|nr:unnamed protein product [Mytilus edulis]